MPPHQQEVDVLLERDPEDLDRLELSGQRMQGDLEVVGLAAAFDASSAVRASSRASVSGSKRIGMGRAVTPSSMARAFRWAPLDATSADAELEGRLGRSYQPRPVPGSARDPS